MHRRGILPGRVLAAEEHAAAVLRPREGVVVVGRRAGRQVRVGAARELVPRPPRPKHATTVPRGLRRPEGRVEGVAYHQAQRLVVLRLGGGRVATADDRDEDVRRLRPCRAPR